MATLVIPCDPKIADIFGTANIPEYVTLQGTNGPVSGYAFDAATMEQIFVRVTTWDYLSGNVSVTLRWESRSASTTGAVVWGAQQAAITPGDAQSVLTKAFATAATTTTTVNSTASGETETIVTITALDSMAAGDEVWIRVYRDAAAGGDTMTGDAVLISINVGYAANSGGGSGDVTGPGTTADNALARFDGTTGKVIQTSDIIIDDSENMTGVGLVNELTPRFIDFGRVTTAFTSSGTGVNNVTGLSITTPSAGTYLAEFEGTWQASSTTGNCSFGIDAAGGTISNFRAQLLRANSTTTIVSGATTTDAAQLGAVVAGVATTDIAFRISATFTCTTGGSVQMTCQKGTSGTMTIGLGSWGRVMKIA